MVVPQNNIIELWSFLNFLMPNMFGDSSKVWFQELNANSDREELAESMKAILNPFILRRLKTQVPPNHVCAFNSHQKVAMELPNKIEKIMECSMTEKQRLLYDNLIQRS